MPHVRLLLDPILGQDIFRETCSALAEGLSNVNLCGLTRSAKALVVAGLAHELRRPLVVLTSDNETAERLREASATFLGWLEGNAAQATVRVLPAFDCSPYENHSPHAEILDRRAETLWNLGNTRILHAPLPAAVARFRERSYYRSLGLEIKVGDELDPSDLVGHLAGVGYEPGEPVSAVGQYSVRGGIIDVFPPQGLEGDPVRLEFLGDRIESLREFDPSTQRSRRAVGSVLLLPLSETKRTSRLFSDLVRVLAERGASAGGGAKRSSSAAEPDWAPFYSREFPGWEFWVPLVEPHPHALLSLFERPILVWDESAERRRQLSQTLKGWRAQYDELRDTTPSPPRPQEIFLTETDFLKSLDATPSLSLMELATGGNISASVGEIRESPRLEFCISTQPAPRFHGAVKTLIDDLRGRGGRRETVAFVLQSSGKADRLREILKEYEIPFESAREKSGPEASEESKCEPESGGRAPGAGKPSLTEGAVLLARGELAEGVVFPDIPLALISDSDLFGEFTWGTPPRRERSGAATFLSNLSDLKVGDYVVHVDHGIALYQGLRQLEVNGTSRDFMLLTYQEDARLYVPLERLDLIEKYRSGDGAKPALDKLGGATWARTKTRVKRALRDMAAELLRLYAERKMLGGIAHSPDTPWQKEFEDAFEFEETPDQLTALADIRRDLESPQPMDRLLCGDVGYGKTELAMRAAFKVAQEGKQVAVLAPTTVLAFQHAATFRQRMAPFPVRVEMLSRFRSAAEQKRVLADTEAGQVDILIGTHRMLSKDVRFRDLGLLIVDEEQRFGVAAKERLKRFSAGVDVLTMSATPIPRTLQMSIGGLRDLSVIETPPRGRLAIQTIVAPFKPSLVQSAILQEMERQGQVFFVHNRVESIFSMAALVQRLVPTARLGVAHGQMGEKELEKVMLKFIQGEYDVLAATALIENGLDIPRANTIIVNHADRFGLADLYQLRGRVGRSNRRAYAYFLVPSQDSLTPNAQRRLAALKEFSALGAGFRLAALDLELRGAGNLLGAEQSGHLHAVGLDLYLQILEQTVEELKGAPAQPPVRTTLNLGLDIKIPDHYIADENQRLRTYKRISSLSEPEARTELEAELVDRYGPIPHSVSNLLSYAMLKSAAEALFVESVERKADEVSIRFHPDSPLNTQKLTQFVRRHREASFRSDATLRFRLTASEADLPQRIANALRELHTQH